MTSISGFPSKVKFDYRHYFPSRDGVMIESEALPDPAVDLDAWLYRTGRYVYAMASARDERTGIQFNGPTCGEIRDTVKARIVAEQRFDTRLVRWYARAEIRRVRKAIADKHPDVSAEAAELWRQVANGFAAYTREVPNKIMNLTAVIVREYDATNDRIGFIADMYSNTEAWAYPSAARGNNPHRWQSLGTDECAAFLVWAVGECARHGVGVGKNGATDYRFYKTTINQALHKTTFLLYNGTEDGARQLITDHLEKVYPLMGTQQELPKPPKGKSTSPFGGKLTPEQQAQAAANAERIRADIEATRLAQAADAPPAEEPKIGDYIERFAEPKPDAPMTWQEFLPLGIALVNEKFADLTPEQKKAEIQRITGCENSKVAFEKFGGDETLRMIRAAKPAEPEVKQWSKGERGWAMGQWTGMLKHYGLKLSAEEATALRYEIAGRSEDYAAAGHTNAEYVAALRAGLEARTKTAITDEQWLAWITATGYGAEQLLNILNEYEGLAETLMLTNVRQWPFDLKLATDLVSKHRAYMAESARIMQNEHLRTETKTGGTVTEFSDVPSEPTYRTDAKPSSAFTAVEINGHIIHATAYAGQSGDDVAESIFALLDGLGKVLKSERVKSYSAIQDGRDRRVSFKANGKQIAPTEQQTEPPPANERTNAKTDDQQSTEGATGGVVKCTSIMVKETYTEHKPCLEFICKGFERNPQYARGNLLTVFKNATKDDGEPFAKDDLVKDEVFGGKTWYLTWTKNGKYTNVESVSDSK